MADRQEPPREGRVFGVANRAPGRSAMKMIDMVVQRRRRRPAPGARPPVRTWISRRFDDPEDEWLETACLGTERDADGT